MRVDKLTTTEAFVVRDLSGAPCRGVVRLAPKVLPSTATSLARTRTYAYALAGIKRGGASAGINAEPAERRDAIEAFRAELADDLASGQLRLDPGPGLSPEEFDQPVAHAQHRAAARTNGIVAAVTAVAGKLDGCRIAVDGAGPHLTDVIQAMVKGGARILAVSAGSGAVVNQGGFDGESMLAALGSGASNLLPALGDPRPRSALDMTEVDIFLAGAAFGAIDHERAELLTARAIVPAAEAPVSPKALAAARRRGIVVLADFVALAGDVLAEEPEGSEDPEGPEGTGDEGDDVDVTADRVTAWVSEFADHVDGPLLGACQAAETVLRSWLPPDQLPFGRPL